MYRFCIENSSQALELVSRLQNEKKPLGRLYFGYLIFLATELDQEAASALLESYNGLDSLTGPYLAGILCIDKIKAKLKGRLIGFDKSDKERIESLTPSHLAFLAQKGNCTHIDLDPPQWQLRSITRSTDHVARVLGLTGKMPCIAIFDYKCQAEAEIVELPKEKELLVSFTRELIDELAQFKDCDKEVISVLETTSDIYSKLENIREFQNVIQGVKRYLREIAGNPHRKISKELKVPKKKLEMVLNPHRIRLLRQMRGRNSISDQELQALSRGFSVPMSVLRDGNDVGDVLKKIANIIAEQLMPGRQKAVTKRYKELEARLIELESKVIYSKIPSVRESARAIAKRRNLTSIRHSILHQAGTIAGEIAKPSFWLKIAKFLQ